MEAASVLPATIRVLIADDEPLFVNMVQAMLATEDGIEIVGAARDGRAAVALFEQLDPDVIVLDVSMPVMDGIEATQMIRDRDPNACILILTGGTTPDDVARARGAGAAAYVTKDRIATELVAEIRKLGSR